MKVVHTPPPNYLKIREVFPEADFDAGILFTYGDTCYCKEITPDLVVHEETHVRQQESGGPEGWWDKYLTDPAFRLSQEVEAYRNQYRFLKKNLKDRNVQAQMLHRIAGILSGSLYGNIISRQEATKLIGQ